MNIATRIHHDHDDHIDKHDDNVDDDSNDHDSDDDSDGNRDDDVIDDESTRRIEPPAVWTSSAGLHRVAATARERSFARTLIERETVERLR